MSAKRREETIRRFSVPIDGDEVEPTHQNRPKRSRRNGGGTVSLGDVSDDNGGSDFDMDDDDFLGDEDDSAGSKNKTQKKGKGKAKPKSRSTKAAYQSAFEGENPRVMLISLKGKFLKNFYIWFLIFGVSWGSRVEPDCGK